MNLLNETLARIQPVDAELLAKAQAKLDNKTKPLRSLGRLEDFACRFAAIAGNLAPQTRKKIIFTFAGDHGVVEEGISAFPKEVTPQMVLNFLNGGAGVNVLARHCGSDVLVVDVGVDFEFDDLPGLIARKIARGTRNFTKGPAMSREEAVAAMGVGIELAGSATDRGGRHGRHRRHGDRQHHPVFGNYCGHFGIAGARGDPPGDRHHGCRTGDEDPCDRARSCGESA